MTACPHPQPCAEVGRCRFDGDCSAPAVCPTVEAVRSKLKARASLGLTKYGTTLAGAQLSRKQVLQHAMEEAMDQAVYLQRLIEMEDVA